MRHLYVLRHAKAVHFDPRYDDFDRPLDAEGRQAVVTLSQQIGTFLPSLELVLCSPSRRTRETLEGVQHLLPAFAATHYDESLYLASWHGLLARIHDLEDSISCALIIGHNPGLEQFVRWVSVGDLEQIEMQTYPTAAFCHLAFNLKSWEEVGQSTAEVKAFIVPEDPL